MSAQKGKDYAKSLFSNIRLGRAYLEEYIKLEALDYQKDINKLEGVQVRKINMIKLLEGYEGSELNIYSLVK